ncbi:excalibur calcium-binding domain-containing protein [Streptomyces tendae]
MTNPYAPPTAGRTTPKWAKKRYVGPALALAFFLGIAAGTSDTPPETDAKAVSAKPQPTVTVTATADPEPAPTVTETVEVEVTETVTADPLYDDSNHDRSGSDDNSTGGGSVYYENCAAARAAGAAPVHRGEPGYASHLDRDGDGTGCDWG